VLSSLSAKFMMAGHQLFNFADERPAQILSDRRLSICRSSLSTLRANTRTLVLGDGIEYLLRQTRLQFLYVPPTGHQLASIRRDPMHFGIADIRIWPPCALCFTA